MKIFGIHHVAIKTHSANYEKALSLYIDVLKLKTVRKWKGGVMISTGDNSVLEIMPDDNVDGRIKGAIQHIALSCDDVDMAFKILTENGCKPIAVPTDITIECEVPYKVRICFVYGFAGEEIELFCEK